MRDRFMGDVDYATQGRVLGELKREMRAAADEWLAKAARQADTEVVLREWLAAHGLHTGQSTRGGNWFCQTTDGFNLHRENPHGTLFPAAGFTTYAAMVEAALDWVLAHPTAGTDDAAG